MLDTPNMNAPQSDSPLLVALSEGVLRLTLNRPRQYNALSAALLDALHAALDDAATNKAVRVVVIAGEGKAFCAGHDLKEMREAQDPTFVSNLFARCSAMMLKIAKLPVPVIAEVQGMATAAGCQLGLFCSTPAVALSRTISRKRAAEMLMTGDFIDAATALDWGLVNRVVPADALQATTLALCETLKGKPRDALAMGKALFYRQMESGIEAAYEDASRTIACNFAHPDAEEGVAAFIEKRKPGWHSTSNHE
jgi:enoyl-CoA hydratase/carnithine racemase